MAGLTEFYCGWNEPSHASQFKWLEYTFNCLVVFSPIKSKFHDKIWKVHQYSNCTRYVCFSVSILSNRVQIPIWFRTRVVMKNSFSDMREICTFPTLNYNFTVRILLVLSDSLRVCYRCGRNLPLCYLYIHRQYRNRISCLKSCD
jgi:hypothetical protein